jgi:class 3 adenylate cyclase/tetratricopeptide (TPR) repeat protein
VATLVCERCGLPLPEEARFCSNCGYPVGAPPPAERKVVTVIFVDLVGSTKLSTLVDPERYREVIAAYYRVVADELESLRGRAYNFAGDAVVGVFGIPHAHDDDALRAVRAGLALGDHVEHLGQELDMPAPLRIRVGIHTGPVAIGAEASEQGLIFGATVNLAARLQQAADPDSVLVSETVYLLSQSQVEYGSMRKVEAKGFEEEAKAWPVLALAPGSTRRTIPFVDRRRQLRLLNDAFEAAREARRGHLVSLFGEPGIGKSRVAEEFLAGLPDDARVLVGRASPFEEDVTFAPIAQVLLHEMDERSDAPQERLLTSLELLVLRCCAPDEAEQVVARLGMALGIGEERRDLERRYRVAEIRSGLLTLLEGLTRDGPVVLVFEDLHAAQPSMLDLVEQLVREAVAIPLLVLCVARYSLLDERPDWGGGRGDSLTVYLEAMSLDDATELALEAGEGLDPEAAERIARHAGGNPFFIVETTGMLRHTGESVSHDTGPLPEGLLPPTVQAVIASRIDHLPQRAKDIVRKASVFSRATFDVSELALIVDADEGVLDVLEDEELLLRDEERPTVWRFRHGLVRDVAYESLPKRERQRLHLLLADELSKDPETASRYPRSIAYHLERAARAALDLEPGNRELAERAVLALAHAGEVALEGSDIGAAEEQYGRALDLAGPQRSWGLREAHILASQGEALYWQGEFERAAPVLEHALELGDGDPEVRARASRFLGDIELSIRGNRQRAAELLGQALAAARELGDEWTLPRTLLVAGWEPYWRGDLETARAMFQEALGIARRNPEGDAWAEARALVTLAMLEGEVGDERDALALGSEAFALAEASRDRFSIGVARESVGSSLRRMDRLEEAEAHLERSVAAFRELSARWELASALTSLGIVRRLALRTDLAIADLKEAYRLCRELKERSIVTWTASELAKALSDSGETGLARRVLLETGPMATTEGPAPASWLLDAEAEILLAEGDRDGALEKALQLLADERMDGLQKDVAAQVVWIAEVFGEGAAGGAVEVARARELLERLHSLQAFREAALVAKR